MSKLPPISEYSFERIWDTVKDDVEEDLQGIAEIWGQHRLVLADQHESQLPPQGEIRATSSSLQAVAEAGPSAERLADHAQDDNIMIADLDASLAEGSNAGSAAYGLLERLQAMPRARRLQSDLPPLSPSAEGPSVPRNRPARNYSSPAILNDIPIITTITVEAIPELPPSPTVDSRRASRNLLHTEPLLIGTHQSAPSRLTGAVVSEVYLSAGANGKVISDPPVVSEAGRHYPLYSYDESEIFEGSGMVRDAQPRQLSFRERMQRLLLLSDFGTTLGWRTNIGRSRPGSGARARDASDAEDHLRGILGRQERERAR
jgi:hypothetical protein